MSENNKKMKNAQPANDKHKKKKQVIKKKRGCRCCMSLLITFVVIIGGVLGVGYYFGDQYTRTHFDMSLSDCLGVFKDLRTANEKDIITNPYSAADKKKFEAELKRQLFLKDNVDLNFDNLVDEIMKGAKSDEDSDDEAADSEKQSQLMNAFIETGVLMSDNAEEETPEKNTNSGAMNYIASLYDNPDNINKERLKEFEESNLSEYMFTLEDKQLAAFIDSILSSVMKSEAVTSALAPLNDIADDIDASKLIKIEQIIFENKVIDGETIPYITVTVSLDIRTVAKAAVKKNVGSWAEFLVNLLLPKKIYITEHTAITNTENIQKTTLKINSMDETRMNRFYKLINNAMKLEGDGIKATLTESTDAYISADTLLIYGDAAFAAKGVYKFDIFEAVISLSGMNEGKGEDIRLNSADVYYGLKYMLTSSYENAVWTDVNTENGKHTWQDIYTKADNTLVYRPGGLGVENDEVRVDYEAKLMNELETKLSLDLIDENGERMSFEELMWYFGIGEDKENPDKKYDFTDLLNANGLKDLSEQEIEDIKVIITDQMLAAMLSRQVETLVGGEGGMADMNPEIMQVAITVHESVKYPDKNRTYMEAGIKIDIGTAFDGADGFASVFKNLLPQYVMISFRMDITLNLEENEEYDDTIIIYNDLSESEVDRLLTILEKLGVNLGKDSIIEQINDPMRDAIKDMADKIPGLTFETSKISLPDIFTLTLDNVVNDGDENLTYEYEDTTQELTAEQLKNIVNKIHTVHGSAQSEKPSENYYGFLNNIINNYFLNGLHTPVEGQEDDGNTVATYNDLSNKFSITSFDATADEQGERKIDVNALMHTAETSENLRPAMTDNELACLIMEMLGSDMNDFKNIVEFSIEKKSDVIIKSNNQSDYEINMTVEIATESLFGGGNQEFKKFIGVDTLHVMITIDLGIEFNVNDGDGDESTEKAYAATLTVNNMSDEEMAQLLALSNHFAGEGNTFSLEEKTLKIGQQIYKQLNDFKKQMGDTLVFEEGGVRIASIFELIANAQTDEEGEKPDAEILRGALQGMYTKDGDSSEYNYLIENVVTHAISDSAESADLISFLLGEKNLLDKEFAAFISNDVNYNTQIESYPALNSIVFPKLKLREGMKLAQMKLYSKDTVKAPNEKYPFENFGDFECKDGVDYFEFVFEMTGFGVKNEDEGSNKYNGLISDTVYATIIITHEQVGNKHVYEAFTVSGEQGSEQYLRINSLTYAQQQVLFNVAKVDTDAIYAQIAECLNMFNYDETQENSNDFFQYIIYGTEEINGVDCGTIRFTKISSQG